MWAAVRQLTGRQQEAAIVDGISAESLNNHYVAISTDNAYAIPCRKETSTCMQSEYVSEWKIFKMLDSLRPTATGLDGLPAWFLRVGAPVFSGQITTLFNLLIAVSAVPQQWKQASIRPIAKVAVPKQHVDFRPISITPILTISWSEQLFSHISIPPSYPRHHHFLRPVCIPAIPQQPSSTSYIQ